MRWAFVFVLLGITGLVFCGDSLQVQESAESQSPRSVESVVTGAVSDATSNDEEKAATAAAASKETRPFLFTGPQRRIPSNNSTNTTSRDNQLLSVLAARRRQILSDRLNAHIATIASLAQKPYRNNGTHAHLEILDKNNTVITKITIPENSTNVKFQWDIRNVNLKPLQRYESPPLRLPTAVDSKSVQPLKPTIQDAKSGRAGGFLNNRRKLPVEGLRFGSGSRKNVDPLPTEENNLKKTDTYNYNKKDDENGEAILEPDEEFQVDESNHGFYLLNFTAENVTQSEANASAIAKNIEESVGNETLTRIIDDTENLINRSAIDDLNNVTKAHERASEFTPTQTPAKTSETRTTKEIKSDVNNTLFISDELYNHFRPLETELPVEDMEPFLFFGQKINKENLSLIASASPSTKAVQYLTTPEKKRVYRLPVTEKTKYFRNEDEEEVNEDMDVSVVKNIIEKNKVRNTIKQPVPVRESGLIEAYRKTSSSTITLSTTTSLPATETVPSVSSLPLKANPDVVIFDNEEASASENRVRVRDNSNRTVATPSRGNRTYTFRRKSAKITMQNSTQIPDSEPTQSTPPQSTTLVYTAVVTSVSITSSIKGLNNSDNVNNTKILDDMFIDRLHNNTAKELSVSNSSLLIPNPASLTTANATVVDDKKSNMSEISDLRVRKRPEFRHRPHRIRTRISTTEKTVAANQTEANSTPFILYPDTSMGDNHTKFFIELTTAEPDSNITLPPTENISIETRLLIPDETIGAGKNKIGKVDVSSTEGEPIATSSAEPDSPTVATDISVPKIEDFGGNILNMSSENSSYYYTDGATTEPTHNVNISKDFDTTNTTTMNATSEESKEVLNSKTGEVTIEAGNTNVATYILAGLGFVPVMAIIFYVLRNFLLKRGKDIDADYDGYFQDPDLKKESQVTPVARPPTYPHKKPDEKWEFPRSKLRLQTLLGQGNFGQVWKAEADDLTGHDGLTRLVAVKTIKETASQKEKQELLHEICIMQKIGTHPNVVTLLACCTEQEPYLLIMEYVMCGKLLTYLRERRSRPDRFGGGSGALTSRDLTVFAYCVARGMDYLASKGIVHRDLAARNILVDHNKLCKIADFGMSREVSDADGGSGECGRSQRHALPVRWMAPEALLYNIYSHETDVWAYGVLLWEIVTLGSTPYAAMTGRQVLHMVTEGYRLERPTHCKQHLYRAMHACWHADPSHRPPFADIKKQLAELLDNEPAEGHYVDLESFYQDSSVYSDPSAIIQNDGGISIEYSRELKPQALTEEPKRRSFNKIAAACNLQRNHSSSFGSRNGFNARDDDFINLRSNSKIGATRMGGFGISNIAFNARESDFSDRKDKLSGFSFQNRDRDNNVITRDSGLVSRNSFTNNFQNRHNARDGGRGFFVNSGSNRSKRVSEFECNI